MEKLIKKITNTPKKNKKDIVGKGTGSLAITANDTEYIEDRTYSAKTSTFNFQWIWIILFIILFLLYRPYRGGMVLFLFSIFGGLVAFAYLYHYIAPTKHFVANRQTGQLRVPISIKKAPVNINFDDGFAYERSVYTETIHTSLFFQSNPDVKPGAVFSLADWEREDYWNFLVWYMDKNRPLPPGKAFAPYREKDFQRRKAEGFPKPLYPSDVPTPEATPEQQAERKSIGGW